MFRIAVEAAAGVLPNASTATVEQVALAVLRVALPLHETQHAAAWKAAHERAVHFEWEAVRATERAEKAEAGRDAANAELERLRDDNDALIKSCRRWMNQATVDFDRARDAGIELERMRAYTGPTVKIEWGVQDATAPVDPLNAVICDSREDARRDAERYSCEVLTNGKPTPHRVVTRLAGAWVEYEVADA